MLDLICMGTAELFGMASERKVQNENICLQRDSNPLHATPRQVNQRLRPLGHGALVRICARGLMSDRIVGDYVAWRGLGSNPAEDI